MNIEPNASIALEGDAELLAKYIECNDRVAIESLIVRYSPMVASVCRVTTRHRCDAEDAFQATFQVLLESARKVRKRQSIAAWLHGVAFRIASRVRAKQQRYSQDISSNQASTREIDEPTDQYDPVVLVTRKIELEKLVIEVQRLPEKIRSAVVEHYLLGLTADEIALRMDTTLSTIEGRLRRGRQVLRARLVKQGISLSIALAAVAVLEQQIGRAHV